MEDFEKNTEISYGIDTLQQSILNLKCACMYFSTKLRSKYFLRFRIVHFKLRNFSDESRIDHLTQIRFCHCTKVYLKITETSYCLFWVRSSSSPLV